MIDLTQVWPTWHSSNVNPAHDIIRCKCGCGENLGTMRGYKAEKEEQQGKKAQSVIAGGDLNAVEMHRVDLGRVVPRELKPEKRQRKCDRMSSCKTPFHRSPSVTDIVPLLVGPTEGGATWFDRPTQSPVSSHDPGGAHVEDM
ncbi:hypothetical protein BHE74_00041634 [Ensete ventricosum]|nr:hypothetical protein BHE74_00041634 [Ensete ventricosum]